LEEIIFENFNNFENNIISVELAKVLRVPSIETNVTLVLLIWYLPQVPYQACCWYEAGNP
jgi:hypothetical protein